MTICLSALAPTDVRQNLLFSIFSLLCACIACGFNLKAPPDYKVRCISVHMSKRLGNSRKTSIIDGLPAVCLLSQNRLVLILDNDEAHTKDSEKNERKKESEEKHERAASGQIFNFPN